MSPRHASARTVRNLRCERGVTLVESLIAVAILGIAIVVFVAGISTGAISTSHSDRLSTAHELGRSQLEHTKAEPYNAAPYTYPSVTAPAGFTVTSTASDISGGGPGIQLITVQVADGSGTVFTLEGFKVDR